MSNTYKYTENRPELTSFSRELRRNMTKEERRLWYDFLKHLNIGFRRQHVIGPYIVDFCCPAARLVIELDGSQHGEEENRIADAERDEYLSGKGLEVLRYRNADINGNFNSVCEDILKHLPEGTKLILER